MARLKRAVALRLPENKKLELYDLIREELHRMVRKGEWDGDPNEHPIKALTRLAYHGETNPSLKFLCLKTMLDFVAVPKSVQLRVDSGVGQQDTNVTVVVQGWVKGEQKMPLAQSCGPAAADEADEVIARPVDAIAVPRLS